jgi:hypothetical protein
MLTKDDAERIIEQYKLSLMAAILHWCPVVQTSEWEVKV